MTNKILLLFFFFSDFIERISFCYPQTHEKYTDVKDKQLLWELIKMEIRMETIKYSKEKRYKFRKRELTLQKELQDLDYKICNTDFENLDPNVLVEYEAAKEELKKIYENRGKEAIFRSKVKWFEQGEKPTKYFFNLEKMNYEKKLIREVKLKDGETITDPKKIEKELENFYSNMYISKKDLNDVPQGENGSFESFVEGIEIPQLNTEERDSLEHDFTYEELKEVVSSFSDNKTPGEDGFTKEFYESFYDLIWRDLLNSYEAAFQNGSLSISQRRGFITLIPKADGDLKELANWRPISLLNVDYKILTKALAKRIEKYLPKLINSDQTGFVKGRYIGQNIKLLCDIMEYVDAKKTSGLLLFIDFEKAFDSLEWDFMNKALNAFNFGPNVKRWITIFYKDVQSAVMNGGFLTTYFNISRGVRQGCPLSPLLFILAMELLAVKIRQDSDCKGISLPDDQKVKISQFADDTTIITENVESLKPHLLILDRFVVMKRELKLFRLADNDKCIYCFNADSIEHTFINCTESVKLYSQIILWFNHCQDTAITLSNEKVAFHDLHHVTDALSGPVRGRLDLHIILVKQYMSSVSDIKLIRTDFFFCLKTFYSHTVQT